MSMKDRLKPVKKRDFFNNYNDPTVFNTAVGHQESSVEHSKYPLYCFFYFTADSRYFMFYLLLPFCNAGISFYNTTDILELRTSSDEEFLGIILSSSSYYFCPIQTCLKVCDNTGSILTAFFFLLLKNTYKLKI